MSNIDRSASAGVTVRGTVGFLSAPRNQREAERRLFRATIRELEMLGTEELAAIGLSREDIPRVASEAAARASRSWARNYVRQI